jgi:hypothetical protein
MALAMALVRLKKIKGSWVQSLVAVPQGLVVRSLIGFFRAALEHLQVSRLSFHPLVVLQAQLCHLRRL